MSFHDKIEIPSKEEWLRLLESKELNRASMNKLIMNYLVTGLLALYYFLFKDYTFPLFELLEGFKEAAEKFQEESGVCPSVELNSLDERIRIREAIINGRMQEATALINQLHPELLDNDRYLYFHLQVISEKIV